MQRLACYSSFSFSPCIFPNHTRGYERGSACGSELVSCSLSSLCNSVTESLLAYWLGMSSFSLLCSTSVHGSILRGQQFIHHPHRLEPHLRAERAPQGVRADRERAAHLQRLWHWALLAKDIWQKSVSYSFLSAGICWDELIVLCAEL